MKMESKRSIIWLLVIMILIYIQQSVITYAQEPVAMYEMKISKPTGKNGYYVEKPEVEIIHTDMVNLTKYQILKDEEVLEEGELNAESGEVKIDKNVFPEGKVLLIIWMENEEGEIIGDTKTEKEFMIDCTKPELRVSAPNGFDTWYAEHVTITADAEDSGSRMKNINCIIDGETKGTTNQEKAEFIISTASVGGNGKQMIIRAEDYAGNVTQEEKMIYIDQQAPQIEISGVKNLLITNKNVKVKYRITEENLLQEKTISVEREDEKGRKMNLSVPALTELAGNRQFQKDGIYKLRIMATDMAGHVSQQEVRFIIDTKKPVIKYVKDVHQKCMQYFRWSKKDFITDFTTYTYEIRLDGKLYHFGEKIMEEGRHLLSISAMDEAGNDAVEKAEFVIDRTGPEIIFENVDEGEVYEKERTVRIRLANVDDTVQKILINGKSQTLTKEKSVYEYTLQEAGDYEILVRAVDLVGNSTEEICNFTIEPEKTKVEKIVEPVRKAIGENSETNKQEKKIYIIPVLAAMLLLIVVCTAAGIYWKRTRDDEEEES